MKEDSNNSNSNSGADKISSKVEVYLGKANNLLDSAKDGVERVNNFSDSVSNTLNNTQDLMSNIGNLGKTYLESQKLAAQTQVELVRIGNEHKRITKIIDNEYNKQNKALDKASDVVDAGLLNNDLNLIGLGLASMGNVANHNPFADLQNSFNKELSDKFDDDDFSIEI